MNLFCKLSLLGPSIFFVSCSSPDNSSADSTTTTTSTTTTVNGDTSKKKDETVEIIKEAGKTAGTIIKDGIEFRRINDSIRNANKDHMWVYQIGPQIGSEELAGKTYDKLSAIPHLYIFKKSKRELYLIKDDGFGTKEQLGDSIGDVKRLVASFTTERVVPLDLAQQCSSKRQPTISDPIKYKIDKEKKQVECRTCE